MSNIINDLPRNVADALERGQVIEAIKLLRESTGLGLKDAKDVIDGHVQGRPVHLTGREAQASLPAAVIEAMQRGSKIEAIRLLREERGLGLKAAKDAVESGGLNAMPTREQYSPGQVHKSVSYLGVVVLLIITIVLAYNFM